MSKGKENIKKHLKSLDFLLKLILSLIVVVAVARFLLLRMIDQQLAPSDSKEQFAICLMKSGAIMYGVDTCEFCQNQKKMFGNAFEKINYINCDFAKSTCQEKGINAYPVWEYQNQQIRGTQTFNTLSKLTGCPWQ